MNAFGTTVPTSIGFGDFGWSTEISPLIAEYIYLSASSALLGAGAFIISANPIFGLVFAGVVLLGGVALYAYFR